MGVGTVSASSWCVLFSQKGRGVAREAPARTGWECAPRADQATLQASSRGPTHTSQSLPSEVSPIRRGHWGCSPPLGPSASLSHQVPPSAFPTQRESQSQPRLPWPAPTVQLSRDTPTHWSCPLGPSRDCSKSKNQPAKEVYLSV